MGGDIKASVRGQAGQDCLLFKIGDKWGEFFDQIGFTSSKESSESQPRVEKYFIVDEFLRGFHYRARKGWSGVSS